MSSPFLWWKHLKHVVWLERRKTDQVIFSLYPIPILLGKHPNIKSCNWKSQRYEVPATEIYLFPSLCSPFLEVAIFSGSLSLHSHPGLHCSSSITLWKDSYYWPSLGNHWANCCVLARPKYWVYSWNPSSASALPAGPGITTRVFLKRKKNGSMISRKEMDSARPGQEESREAPEGKF